jgi:ABC-type tungstate transport system permease subunit
MTLSSYSDIFSIVHDREHEEEILQGDIVRCGENHYPHFEVIALSGDTAWVRNVLNGADSLTPLSRCRRLENQPLRVAAE